MALGTAYGGAIFMLTVALGLGVLVAPLQIQLPAPMPWLLPCGVPKLGHQSWPGL
ncbi:MAG TPA: hypothetical protein VFJ07_02225 [Streptosporangiaceae bacterium]|nr:hypothetical protein [Streptosporangiaceae bacterium]